MNQKNTYYILQHSRPYVDDYYEEVRDIWIFSTKKQAIEIKKELLQKPWFKDYPKWFYIWKCLLDRTFWNEWFI